MSEDLSFPRRHARSQRFSLGRPREITVVEDGRTVLFARSEAGDDPVHHLWALDVASGQVRRVLDAHQLAASDADLPAAERARRERARESGGGVVSYATDDNGHRAVTVLGGQGVVVDVADGRFQQVLADGPVYDLRLSPDGQQVAGVIANALHVGPVGERLAPLVDEPGVSWGVADFVAAEEMRRMRGFWWSGDGSRLYATRVDDSAVASLTIADPANPTAPAVEHRYPLAGTANPDVRLFAVDATTGTRTEVTWDRATYPYLAVVRPDRDGRPALLQVQSRDQRSVQVLAIDETGATEVRATDTDPWWVELVPGAPRWAGDRLLTVEDRADHGDGGSRALVLDGQVVTPPELQVRSVVAADDEATWFTASERDATQVHVHRLDLATGRVDLITTDPGVHGVAVGGDTVVLTRATLSGPTVVDVRHGGHPVGSLPSTPMEPGIEPRVELFELGPHRLAGALLRPPDGTPEPWPVLLDPYGGPHAQRVVRNRDAFLTPAWFAQQGFAVLVVDGRGSPGRGPAFDRAIHRDLADVPIADQLDALDDAAQREPRLDLARVGIRGWSYGGFLAAAACLRRPDRFRVGIVGAPVTDWRLYDTHYTERYLGHPDDDPEAYRRSSVVDVDGVLVGAANLADGVDAPELLVIHGLADDNVVAAHSLRLSGALLAAGWPHAFLPLSGVTHMTPQEVVAEHLLLVQRDLLRRVLR